MREITVVYKNQNFSFSLVPRRRFSYSPAVYIPSTKTIYIDSKFEFRGFSGKQIRRLAFYHLIGHVVFEEIRKENPGVFEIDYCYSHPFVHEIIAWSLGLSILCDLKGLDFNQLKEESGDFIRECLLACCCEQEAKAEFGMEEIRYLDIDDDLFLMKIWWVYKEYYQTFDLTKNV